MEQQPILVTIDEASNCILAYDFKGSKSHSHIVTAETKLIAAFRSLGHTIRSLHSDSEATLLSTEVFFNTNSIQLFSFSAWSTLCIGGTSYPDHQRQGTIRVLYPDLYPSSSLSQGALPRRCQLLQPGTYRSYQWTLSSENFYRHKARCLHSSSCTIW